MTIAAPVLKNTPVPRRGLPAGLTKSASSKPAPLAAAAAAARASRAGPPADFFNVRLHPNAAEVTAPLQARAVTRGQDVYFHPGQYQPGTPQGQALIAHELAHTLQTRQADRSGTGREPLVSRPGDAFEKNADALARGETAHALAAPADAALRSPFDSESPADRTRREQLLQSIGNATNRLIQVLQSSGLLNFETATTRG
ncbi:MAG TPA: DUF4157 domain-containing protein, partial [Opitutaceae bacterium]|nr:DUF4157 domain-containing protein [Opitutaceae bacterium]